MDPTYSQVINVTATHVLSQKIFKAVRLPSLDIYGSPIDPSEFVWNAREWMNALSSGSQDPRFEWRKVASQKGVSLRTLAEWIELEMGAIKAAGGAYIPICDRRYPQLLRHIATPPPALMTLGNYNLLSLPMVAIIGARKASAHAVMQTELVSRWLVDRGLVVVSGGALGCDIAAHFGTLLSHRNPGSTVAVLACGLRRFYPRQNQRVFDAMLKTKGVFVSERLWSSPCRPRDFPIRNRIISGMAGKVLLMQATIKSGSYLTANLALDQGREVYVLSHPAHDVRACGSRALMEDGAISFENIASFEDVWIN